MDAIIFCHYPQFSYFQLNNFQPKISDIFFYYFLGEARRGPSRELLRAEVAVEEGNTHMACEGAGAVLPSSRLLLHDRLNSQAGVPSAGGVS